MQGLGTIVRMNTTKAERLGKLIAELYPIFAQRILGAPPHLVPVPILWGDELLAISWNRRRDGQLIEIEVLNAKGLKKIFRQLPDEVRTRILRSTGLEEE